MREPLPSDETRLRKNLGVAVTTSEDLIQNGAASEHRQKAQADASGRLEAVKNYIDRLRSAIKTSNRIFSAVAVTGVLFGRAWRWKVRR